MEKTMPDVNKIWENLTIADNFIFSNFPHHQHCSYETSKRILGK